MVVKNGISGIIMICFLFLSCINKKPDIEKIEMNESVLNDIVIEHESVSTYRFEPGTYYILDGRVNVRTEPNLSGKIIGQLEINSQIKIIECAFNEQVIDDVSAYWYKIEYNNSYGYIWGGYIAVQTLIYDIDNNGVNDFFHYRISKVAENKSKIINGFSDVFAYINNEIIPLELKVYNYYIWEDCNFYEGNNFLEYPINGVIIFSVGNDCWAYYGIFPNGTFYALEIGWKETRMEYNDE
jgi:hypothetical protein